MDQDVKVTVGIPFYNAGKYLAFAIQSIINQSYDDLELILVDDGSTDNSLEVAKSFNDQRIRVIYDNTNRGISFRLNQIITEAKGQFIARMDADDIAFTERLEEQVKMFETDPFLDIVDSEVVIINEHNELTGKRAIKSDVTSIRETFDSVRFIHPTVMFKKSFIEKFRYNSEFDGAEDRDLWIRCFKTAHIAKINHPLYFYREGARVNISVYSKRSRRLIKLYKKHRDKITAPFYYALLIKLGLKLILYWIFVQIRADSFLLKRRNESLTSEEMLKYSEELIRVSHIDWQSASIPC